jgi:pimeloyl-ACP methyl ester carboxylesterase
VTAHRVDLRGLEVAYHRSGQGRPLLFLHGLGFARRWLALHERLAGSFDVIAPDHPGFGDSAPATWMRDFDDLALHYAELAEMLDLGPFHLVGHSFGGWVAAEFAAFYPERVRTLTLITPLGLRVRGQAPVDLFRMGAEQRLDVIFNGRADAFSAADEEQAPVERLLADYADLTAFGRFAWNPRYDVRLDRRLGRVKCPSLVIGAQDDRVLPPAHLTRYAELLPDARVTVVRGAGAASGHGLVAQEPDSVAAEIESLASGR